VQSKVEQKRVRDANRAVEHRKKEDLKADQIVHNAEVRLPFLYHYLLVAVSNVRVI
jgi:hypothetical protein